jgi:hypothetical protein
LVILAVCQALLFSGCTTALWERDRFACSHWPANPPNLRLFYSDPAHDLLAEYDEVTDASARVQRRAYWLEPNAAAIEAGREPQFLASTNAQGLAAIPVTGNPAYGALPGYRGLYAVVSTNGRSFYLYSGQKELGCYGLPAYLTTSGQRVKQVLLTPLAVAADATVVGGGVALVGGAIFVIGACESGGNPLDRHSYGPP